MADDQNAELSLDGGEGDGKKGGSKKKLIIIIVAVVLLLGGGAGAFFFFTGDDSGATAEQTETDQESSEDTGEVLVATYVPMPRPFVFNVQDGKRDRLVQIKVQLMVRGSSHAAALRKHIPLLEGTLVSVFSAATVEQLRSPTGKEELREYALKALNEATNKVEKKALIDSVLFTGFVLQ